MDTMIIPRKMQKTQNMCNVVHEVAQNTGVRKIVKKDPVNHGPFVKDFSNFKSLIKDNYDDMVKEARQYTKLASAQKTVIPETNRQYIDIHKNMLNFNGNNDYSEQAKKMLEEYKNNKTRKRTNIMDGRKFDNFIMQNNEFVDYNVELKGARHPKKNVNFISVDNNEDYSGMHDEYQNIAITLKPKKPQINLDNIKPQKEYDVEPENTIKISHIVKNKKGMINNINSVEKNLDIIADNYPADNNVNFKPKKPAIIINSTNSIFYDENTYNVDNKANVDGLYNKTKRNKTIMVNESLNEKIYSDLYQPSNEKIDFAPKLHSKKNIVVNPHIEKIYDIVDDKTATHVVKKIHKIPIDYQPESIQVFYDQIQPDVPNSLNETRKQRVMKPIGLDGIANFNDYSLEPQNNSIELKPVQKKNKYTPDVAKIYTDVILTDEPELIHKLKKRNLSVKNIDNIVIDTSMLIDKLDNQFEDNIKKNVRSKNKYNSILNHDGEQRKLENMNAYM